MLTYHTESANYSLMLILSLSFPRQRSSLFCIITDILLLSTFFHDLSTFFLTASKTAVLLTRVTAVFLI